MNFEAYNKTIKELLSDHIFKIPINQRKYVWDGRNWKDLLSDIFLVCDEKTDGHFIGSIVLEDAGENNAIKYYTIIDGQQRIITITILLTALYQLYLDNDLIKESEAIKKYCFAHNSNNDSFFVLENMEIGLKGMIEEVFSKKESFEFLWIESSWKNSSNANIFNAYNYFYNSIKTKINELGDSSKKYLKLIFETVLAVTYINIISLTNDDSYTIFEILNARGQKLEDFELLKNLLLKYSKNKEDTKTKWEAILQNLTVAGKCHIKQFIKHFSMHKFLSKNYQYPYLVIRDNIDKTNIAPFIDDIYKKSLIYRQFLAPEELSNDSFEKPIFLFFKKNKQIQYRPIIMSLINQFKKGNIDKTLYEKTLLYLRKFFICFTLISMEKSNKIENIIYKYSSMLENDFSIENLNLLIESLKKKFVTKSLFSKRLETLAWSKLNNSPYHEEKLKEKVYIVLDLIEEYYTKSSPIIEYSIEHILPDDGGDDNSKIGNLLPLEFILNRRCQTKPLMEKLPIYNESQLVTPRKFYSRYIKEEFKIESRHSYIVNLLYDKILNIE